eukprot:257000_1
MQTLFARNRCYNVTNVIIKGYSKCYYTCIVFDFGANRNYINKHSQQNLTRHMNFKRTFASNGCQNDETKANKRLNNILHKLKSINRENEGNKHKTITNLENMKHESIIDSLKTEIDKVQIEQITDENDNNETIELNDDTKQMDKYDIQQVINIADNDGNLTVSVKSDTQNPSKNKY